MGRVTLPNLLWYGNEPRRISFPERWEVSLLEPPGFRKNGLGAAGISEALAKPIGTPPLRELAAGVREVAVVFDDMTRPTPVRDMIPTVLEELEAAGVLPGNIRFIPALGMHGAMNNLDFRKKLGEEVVRDYPVFNHNPYENCDYLGDTEGGVPVYINREFMSCDLRVGLGCITPHLHVGFGGGGKIILPGIAGFETIRAFHGEVMQRGPETTGLGRFEGNAMYEEVKEVTRMAGLHFKVDALLNSRGEITDVFAGDPVEAHRAGAGEAKTHYGTSPSPGNDIVVVNAYAKYSEMAICMLMALSSVNFAEGTIVVLVDAPEGQVCHYLMRSFGKEYGGCHYIKRGPLPETVTVIVCSAYPDRTMCDLFAPYESVTPAGDWEETLALLEEQYPGDARVAVIPDGTMQHFLQ